MIDQLTIQRILDAANIVDVVSEFVTLKRRGVNYVGLCPFHNERTPSFSVSPARGICHCFSCGEGGNAIHFIMKHEQMSFTEAAVWLAGKYGIPVEQREMTDREKALQSERESMFITNSFAREWFHDKLRNTPKGVAIGMAYFRKRGFRDDIIEKFQLGYCPDEGDALAKEASAKGYTEKSLVSTGLCYKKDDGTLKDRFWGRVIFPVFSLSGKTVAFGGRVMQSDAKTAKYVNSPESAIYSKSNELYGMYQAKKAIINKQNVYLVEGYADVISMYQSGVENVVASSGTSLTTGQIRMIRRFTDNITVLYDGDSAGIHASERGVRMLLAEGMHVKVVSLPDGEDPDSYAQTHTPTQLLEFLEGSSTDFISFTLKQMQKKGQNDPVARSKAISEIIEIIAVIPDNILRAVYITEISQAMGISEKILVADVNAAQLRQAAAPARPVRPAQDNAVADAPQQPASGPDVPDSDAPSAGTAPEPELSAQDRLKNEIKSLKLQGFGPMMDRERLLSRLIVRYGGKTLCSVEGEGGSQDITVGQFICQTLAGDGLEFHHPVYKRFVEIYNQDGSQPGFDSERHFLSHPENFVSLTAASLMEERYQLSSLFEKNKPVRDEDHLYDLTRHIMADYQMEVVRLELKKVEQQLQDTSVTDNPQLLAEAQKRYQSLLQARTTLSRLLGDRIM